MISCLHSLSVRIIGRLQHPPSISWVLEGIRTLIFMLAWHALYPSEPSPQIQRPCSPLLISSLQVFWHNTMPISSSHSLYFLLFFKNVKPMGWLPVLWLGSYFLCSYTPRQIGEMASKQCFYLITHCSRRPSALAKDSKLWPRMSQ